MKERPLDTLLLCEPESLTDSEIERILKELPVTLIPTAFLLESIERKCREFWGDDFGKIKSIKDIPEEYFQKMRECLNDVPASIEK